MVAGERDRVYVLSKCRLDAQDLSGLHGHRQS